MTKTVPEGFDVSGVSTLYNGDGELVAQWVKSRAKAETIAEAIRQYVAELADSVKPRKAVKPPRTTNADLMAVYPIGDHHFGMYADVGIAGDKYDLERAKSVLAEAVDFLVDNAPAAETAILANLGDFLHCDDSTNRTRRSGHELDISGYYYQACRAAAFTLSHAAERLLKKHKHVRIVNCPGNHDGDSAKWLSLFLAAWFKDEPRVTIDESPGDWLFHKFGRNMLCFTHGHRTKLDSIPGVMANLEPEIWGSTSYRMAFTGHVHHAQRLSAKEHAGAVAESFGILAPSDSHAHNLGYRSYQEMHSLIFAKEGGVKCRTTYNVTR